MPVSPQQAPTYNDRPSYGYDSHVTSHDLTEELNGDESAASILQSVKEQVTSLSGSSPFVPGTIMWTEVCVKSQ